MTAFNTAFAQDGVLLYVPKNVVVEKPIQLVLLERFVTLLPEGISFGLRSSQGAGTTRTR